jgi:FAD synthase
MIPRYELIGKQNPVKPIVAIGNFDGVHCGHQKILNHLKDKAKSKNVDSVVITLDKHPQNVLHPEKIFKVLTTKEEKIKILTSIGIDTIIVIEFNPQTAMMDAVEFYYALLEGKLEASGIVVGYDHAFGHDRKGDSEFLNKLADKTGIEVIRVNPAMEDIKELKGMDAADAVNVVNEIDVVNGEEPISSTKIREKILNGNCEEAARLLGRPYRLTGIIEKGFGRGHKIGFPTANINVLPIKPIPLDGVYAVKVYIDEKVLGGMMNIGENKTLTETKKL